MTGEWDVVVVGGANMDYLARGPRLPKRGETVQGHQFQQAPGGKGANQAIAAARLGARTALVARVGADTTGDAILARLTAEGVDTTFLLRDEAAPTGIAVIHVDNSGQKQMLTCPGANLELSPADVHAASQTIRRSRVLLLQLEPPLDTVATAIRLADDAQVRVVLDPAPARELPNEVLRLVDVIRPNSGEAQVLTGIHVVDRDSAREAARALLARGVGAVVVQAGEEGDLAVWSDGEKWMPRFNVPTVDSTGAGDAFAAAIATELAADRKLSEAAAFGSAVAALATTKLGAQAGLPRHDEVLAFIRGRQAAATRAELESDSSDQPHS